MIVQYFLGIDFKSIPFGNLLKNPLQPTRHSLIHEAMKRVGDGRQMSWLSLDKVNLSGTFLGYPKREDIPTPVEEQLIVELYSK